MRFLRAGGGIVFGAIVAVLVVEISFRLAGALAGWDGSATGASNQAHDVVLCVGDSHTWGLGKGYPARLGELLAERSPRYRVINLGVPGSNTAQVRKRLPDYLERFQPMLVVLWAGVNNKYNRSDSEAWQEVGVAPPHPLRALLDSSRFLRFVRLWRNELDLNRFLDGEGAYVKPDDGGGGRKVAGANGTRLMRFRRSIMGETDIFDHVRGDYLPGAEVARVTELDVRAIVEQARAQGIRIVLVTYPTDRGWFHEANLGIRAAAVDLAAPIVESSKVLQRLKAELIGRGEGAPREMFFDRSAHPQQRLYDAIAAAILETADSNGLLDGNRSADTPQAAGGMASQPSPPADLATVCDGNGDSSDALQAAYEEGASKGGGAIIVPPGRTCRIGTTVRVRSRTSLRCAPGGRIVADVEATAALAGSDLEEVVIEDCDVIVSGRGGGALALSGSGLRVRDLRVRRDEGSASERPLVQLACRGEESCHVSENLFRCGAPVPAGGRALEVSTADGGRAHVRNNEIRGCRSGMEVSGRASIVGNAVAIDGESGVGIGLRTGGSSGADVSRNNVRAKGRGARGIHIVGRQIVVSGNSVAAVGEDARAFAIEGVDVRVVGNAHEIDGSGAIGYETWHSNGVIISSCTGRASKRELGQVHVSLIRSQHLLIDGCVFRRGAYGVAQDPPDASLNVTVDSNRMIGMTAACVVATTGFTVTNNYCGWLSRGAAAVVLGDDRPPGTGNLHTGVTGNMLHCPACPALMVATASGGRCLHDPSRACRDASDCPTRKAPSGGKCEPARLESIVIANNSFLGATHGVGLDLGRLQGTGAAAVDRLVIQGNLFSMHGSCTAIRFPSDRERRSSIRGVEIGANSSRCPTYLSGFDEAMGRAATSG